APERSRRRFRLLHGATAGPARTTAATPAGHSGRAARQISAGRRHCGRFGSEATRSSTLRRFLPPARKARCRDRACRRAARSVPTGRPPRLPTRFGRSWATTVVSLWLTLPGHVILSITGRREHDFTWIPD